MGIKLKKLKDQVIVITGASSGIGLATAKAAARQGAAVVLAARSKETLDRIVADIVSEGGRAVAVECDVSDRQQVDLVAATALQQFGRIDTWVNVAGLGLYGRLDEVTEQDSRRLFDINFWGVVNGSLAALPFLKRQGGCLINVGSELSEAYTPLLGMYTASKHAVKGFTDCLRVEVEQVDGAPVSVTLIQPTAVDTPFPRNARNYLDSEAKLPDSRIEPEQVAEAILSAAVKPARAKRVGFGAKLNAAAAKLVPAIADRMSARNVEELHTDERPRNPQGALYQPCEISGVAGQTHGAAAAAP